MLLRERQKEFVNKSVAALLEHGDTLGVAPTGCHAAGTGILMFDGTIKNVEDIEVGDILMGPDSTSRIVQELHRGKDQMYEIRPIKGESFIVNEGHILSLKKTNEGVYRSHIYSPPEGTIVNISVKDYLATSANFKHLYKLYRTKINFDHPDCSKDLPIDPYFLGVLIGDGSISHNSVAITSMEPEIALFCQYSANALGLRLRIEQTPISQSNTYFFVTSNSRNILKTTLKELGLYGKGSCEKFIPPCYKVASEPNRAAILAGLLDTDGYTNGSVIEYCTASEVLAKDVAFIARSLGFMALPKSKKVNGVTYYRFFICGDLSTLPMKVARKFPTKRRQIKNVLRTGFSVHPSGVGEYYGFTVDKDNLYVMGDFTVTHNSGKTLMLSAVVGELDKRYPNFKACVLAHRDELTTQNMSKFNKINPHLTTSLFNAESKCWKGNTTFGMVQTLSREENLRTMPRLNLLVIDEAHHATADSYRSIIERAKELNPKVKIFGVTATPNRGDKTSLGKVFSNCADQIKINELINDGHLVRPRTFVIDLGNTREKLKALQLRAGGDYADSDVADILDSTPLNSEVVRHWQEKAGSRKTVVFCSTIEHARHVVTSFQEANVKVALVTSECSTAEREKILAAVTNSEIQVLVNVAILTEGWDFPPVSCVILLRQSSYKSTMIQMIGRGLRVIDNKIYPGITKEDCIVLDFGISSIIHGNLEQVVDIKSQCEGFKQCFKCKKKIPKEVEECPLCGYELAKVYQAIAKAAEPQRVIEHFNMSEVDLMERLSFSWTKLKTKTKAMIAAGFNSWCCLIQQGKNWIATFGLTRKGVQEGLEMPTQVIYEGSKTEAMTIADDFLHKFEEQDTSGKLASWKHAPASQKQLEWLPSEYKKGRVSLTKGDASNYLTFAFSAESQLKELGIYK